ncbi:MAG TPA: lytic transglycosylase domain-containing protein [Acidobacteriota bacterium]|nr:lytic transglycosylase domain-containing protein [Acidobacteriota bacterium]
MSIMKMLSNRKAEIGACILGLACGYAFSLQTQADAALVMMEQAAPAEVSSQETVSEDSAVQDREHEFIRDLAREFRMDEDVVRLVHRESKRYVQPEENEWRLLRTPEAATYIMLSVIHAESRGDASVIGDGGRARGLTQIHWTTAQLYGDVTPEELLDPAVNIRFSFRHFHYLLKRYKGNFPLALYGWNRGPGTVDRLIRYGHSPANHYGRKVYHAAANHDKAEELKLIGN